MSCFFKIFASLRLNLVMLVLFLPWDAAVASDLLKEEILSAAAQSLTPQPQALLEDEAPSPYEDLGFLPLELITELIRPFSGQDLFNLNRSFFTLITGYQTKDILAELTIALPLKDAVL